MNAAVMTGPSVPLSPRLLARIAGFVYLLIILGGFFGPFALAPTGMMLGDGALPSLDKILSSKPLYVLGGAVQLIVYACDIVLVQARSVASTRARVLEAPHLRLRHRARVLRRS